VLVASPGMSPGNAGIVTETGFEWVSGWDRITAWPRSPTADIGFRRGLRHGTERRAARDRVILSRDHREDQGIGTTRKGGLIYPRERRAFTFQLVLDDPTARLLNNGVPTPTKLGKQCGLEDTDRILRPRAPRGSRQGAAAIDRSGRLTKCLVVDDQRPGRTSLTAASLGCCIAESYLDGRETAREQSPCKTAFGAVLPDYRSQPCSFPTFYGPRAIML
jgi:hypothetical protein